RETLQEKRYLGHGRIQSVPIRQPAAWMTFPARTLRSASLRRPIGVLKRSGQFGDRPAFSGNDGYWPPLWVDPLGIEGNAQVTEYRGGEVRRPDRPALDGTAARVRAADHLAVPCAASGSQHRH